jgi:hypothetical protein
MFGSMDLLVVHEIIQVMSRFPISIPLVIKNVEKIPQRPNREPTVNQDYNCLLNLMIGPTLKWQSKNDNKIVEHDLFAPESKYFMIAALRLGNRNQDPKQLGKSTILNQLFSTPYMFSSSCEAGAKYGKPVSLDGSIELAWLTRETCNNALWSMIKDNYSNQSNDRLILIANLHGHALDFKEQLSLLKRIANHFLVFIMPDEDGSGWESLVEMIGSMDRISYAYVNPESEKDNNEIVIDTQRLTNDLALEKLRREVATVTKNQSFKCLSKMQSIDELGLTRIKIMPQLKTSESETFIRFLKVTKIWKRGLKEKILQNLKNVF